MKTVRQQIKEKVKSLLEGMTVNQKDINVLLNDPWLIASGDLPVITINGVDDTSEDETVGYPKVQDRTLNLSVTCLYSATYNAEEHVEEMVGKCQLVFCDEQVKRNLKTDAQIVSGVLITDFEYKDFTELDKNIKAIEFGLLVNYQLLETEPFKVMVNL